MSTEPLSTLPSDVTLVTSRFAPPVRDALDAVFSRRRTSPPGTPRGHVVFDFDNTLIRGDIGDCILAHLCQNRLFRFDEAWFSRFDERDGASAVRGAHQALSSGNDGAGDGLLRAVIASYLKLVERCGSAVAYPWLVTLCAGLSEAELTEISERCVDHELARPTALPLPERADFQVGIRIHTDLQELVQCFHRHDFGVWVCSATNVWTVRVSAARFGIPAHRVLGNRVVVENGRLTTTLVEPTLYGPGKATAMGATLGGERPLLAFGDAFTDLELLRFAERGVLIDRGNPKLREAAAEHGFAVQPARELRV